MEANKNLEIYNAISALIQDPTFGDSQFAFYEKNAEEFEDNVEENKLEHTNIHQEYVHILESIMEANLKQKYSDDEINNFYIDFASDMKKYEGVNPNTMDQLYGFIDFVEFKKNLLHYKTGVRNLKGEELKDSDDAYRKTMNNMIEDPLAKYYELCKEDLNDPKFGWTKTVTLPEKNGIEIHVFKRKMEGSSLDLGHSQCTMRGVNVSSMVKFSEDYEKHAHRMDKKNMLKSFKWIVNNDPKGYFLFTSRSRIGAMASDRDSVVEMRIQEVDGGKSLFFLCQSVERDDFPELDDCVRMKYYKAQMFTQEGPDMKVTTFENVDLRGYFPSSLMNMIMSTYTVDSLKGFYEVLKEIENGTA